MTCPFISLIKSFCDQFHATLTIFFVPSIFSRALFFLPCHIVAVFAFLPLVFADVDFVYMYELTYSVHVASIE